jgi:hypothetical protein
MGRGSFELLEYTYARAALAQIARGSRSALISPYRFRFWSFSGAREGWELGSGDWGLDLVSQWRLSTGR